MLIDIPADVLHSSRMTPNEIRLELAIHLYAQGKLSLGKARELAQLSRWEFRHHLAVRRIPPHYDVDDLENDVQTLRELGLL